MGLIYKEFKYMYININIPEQVGFTTIAATTTVPTTTVPTTTVASATTTTAPATKTTGIFLN